MMDKKLMALSLKLEPIGSLRDRTNTLHNVQIALSNALEALKAETESARERELFYVRQIGSAEQKIATLAQKLEQVCAWQTRIGQVLATD